MRACRQVDLCCIDSIVHRAVWHTSGDAALAPEPLLLGGTPTE